jgi:hypothetical protein
MLTPTPMMHMLQYRWAMTYPYPYPLHGPGSSSHLHTTQQHALCRMVAWAAVVRQAAPALSAAAGAQVPQL